MAKVRDPGAVAATIGRKKYGKKKFQRMAARGQARTGPKTNAPGGGKRFARMTARLAKRR